MIKSLLLASVACTHLLTNVADARDPVTFTKVGTWQMGCVGPKHECELIKTVAAPQDPGVSLRIGILRQGDGILMILRTPTLTVPKVQIALDTGDVVTLTRPECGLKTCRIPVAMTYQQTRKFKDARTAVFTMDLKSGGLVQLIVNVEDLWDSLDALPRDV